MALESRTPKAGTIISFDWTQPEKSINMFTHVGIFNANKTKLVLSKGQKTKNKNYRIYFVHNVIDTDLLQILKETLNLKFLNLSLVNL